MAVDTHPASIPASHQHAAKLLRARGLRVERIIRVDPDAILYLNARSKPMTAWVTCNSSGAVTQVRFAPGFPAYPPAELASESVLSRAAAADDIDGA